MMNLDSSLMVSRRKAAEILNCSPKTVYRLERSGRLKGVKISSRTTRYYRTDIARLISDSTVAAHGE